MQEYVDIGWVSRPRGLRGQVWVTPYSDDPERLLQLREFRIRAAEGWRTLRLEEGRLLGNRLSLLFEGVHSRTLAEALCARALQMPRRDLPPLAEDEVFLVDLIGLEARLTDGRVVGRVEEVLELPAGPMLEIHARGLEALVPFQRRFVPRLDVQAGWLELEVPDGLLPEEMLAPPTGEAEG
ncbi:MAG: ribosome maturation factor RimM [Candidatus Delongbacteria bacterium]